METKLKTLSDLFEKTRKHDNWGRNRSPSFSRIRITLGYPAAGCVQIVMLEAGYRFAVIQASDLCCPFLALNMWLRELLQQQLPAMASVDEEGRCKVLIAAESQEGPEFMQLAVLVSEASEFADLDGSEKALLECTVKRLEFVEAFASEVERVAAAGSRPPRIRRPRLRVARHKRIRQARSAGLRRRRATGARGDCQ